MEMNGEEVSIFRREGRKGGGGRRRVGEGGGVGWGGEILGEALGMGIVEDGGGRGGGGGRRK